MLNHDSMWVELRVVFDTLSNSCSVRAVVLSGAGNKAFSTGLDVQQASKSGPLAASKADDPARAATSIRRHIREFQDCVSTIEKCEKPVICVMHGYAFGLAIDISTCADVRICSEDAKFSVKEVDVGLAADIGTLSRLPKIVGSTSWVKDISLTARTFGSAEALKEGFVSAVYSNKENAVAEGIKWAALVASKSPVAVQGTKELLNWSQDHSIKDGEQEFFALPRVMLIKYRTPLHTGVE